MELNGTGPSPVAARACVAAIGVFDGVHLGHRFLIEQTVRYARTVKLPAVVITFNPHPASVITPASSPPLLMPIEDRLQAISRLGVDHTCVLNFTSGFAALTAEEFVQSVLIERLGVRTVFVGFNFRFGARGQGTAASLRQLGSMAGFGVEVVPAVRIAEETVSSTGIRNHVAAGRVDHAALLLGRPFEVAGPVIREYGRGRTLGFPTANVRLNPGVVVPARGVYAVTVDGPEVGGLRPGVANVGVRPTFRLTGPPVLEIHIFNFSAEIYGTTVRTAFYRRLRPERKFGDSQELIRQIEHDCREARRLLDEERHVYNELKLC